MALATVVRERLAETRPALWRMVVQGQFRSYRTVNLRRDVLAGITVGVVALPLAMAFAIATGVGPERGLHTAIIAGFLISFLGGSRFQIGGPTGAFVVIIASVLAAHGYPGLVAATLLAGVILLVSGFLGLGKLLHYIPYPVTTGFTTGIGLLIATTQLGDFLGLTLTNPPADFLGRLSACAAALPTLHLPTLGVALTALAAILATRRFLPRVPAPMVGVLAGLGLSELFGLLGADVVTIGARFGEIPARLPELMSTTEFGEVLRLVPTVLPEALTIAFLAGIESLLSAVVADGMTGERHDSSMELMAQGLANGASVLCGGIPATGAIARTATNIRAGAFSPVSGIVHALTLSLFILVLAPVASRIPLASLAAVLLVVAWDMSELHRFRRLLSAPVSDAVVLLATFSLTVLWDLTVAVEVGVVLAALLFMRRMSELTDVRLVPGNGKSGDGGEPAEEADSCPVPLHESDILVYEVDGPFFFGVAAKFSTRLSYLGKRPKVVVIDLSPTPVLDATGAHALESAVSRLAAQQTVTLLAGAGERLRAALRKLGTESRLGPEVFHEDVSQALVRAREIVARAEEN